MFIHHVGLDQPAEYIIKIQGRLNATPADWFQGPVACKFETGEQGEGITVLQGVIADQPALHGLLNYIRNLGLILLYVDCLTARSEDETKPESSIDQSTH